VPLSAEAVQQQAAASGFPADAVEKVARLMHLLDAINRDDYLRDRFALKGGTALNLFHFGLPRLSVDLDLNYIGSADRRVMLAERLRAEAILERLCAQAGLILRRKAAEHLGGKWILGYSRTSGGRDAIEIDLNYGLRVPLWPPRRQDSALLGMWQATDILLLDEHELAGGKLVALLTRTATRDLFDAYHLLTARPLNPAQLRLATLVYGAMSRTD
jgi:predicted nucleotidyltransferase component of viral defense system